MGRRFGALRRSHDPIASQVHRHASAEVEFSAERRPVLGALGAQITIAVTEGGRVVHGKRRIMEEAFLLYRIGWQQHDHDP